MQEMNRVGEKCGYCVCTGGHEWPTKLQLGTCPGCQGQVIARKLENCPICNEPAETINLRIDHLGNPPVLVALCKGQGVPGFSGVLTINRDMSEGEVEWLKKQNKQMSLDLQPVDGTWCLSTVMDQEDYLQGLSIPGVTA